MITCALLHTSAIRRAVLPAILLFLTLSAWARIGETPEQCAARYGEPLSEKDGIAIFLRSGLTVAVRFYEGRADLIMYAKATKDDFGNPAALSPNEIQLLLKSNGGDAVWQAATYFTMNDAWTADGLQAEYDTWKHMLMVTTTGALHRAAAAKATEEAEALEGL